MPTVLRVAGFSFHFYAGDHEPAHVHVANGDGIAIIAIATACVRQKVGSIREKDVRRAEVLVAEYRDDLQSAWTEFMLRRGGSR